MEFDIQCIRDSGHFDDFIFAYKIVEKAYVQNIVEHGQIYFGLLRNYRKMEQESKSAVGDAGEATVTKQVREYLKVNGEYVEIHGPNAGYNCRVNANQCAFCLYSEGLKSFEKLSENKYQYTIPCFVIEAVCKDKGGVGNCAIIIFDTKVIRKIYDALKKKKLQFSGQKVIYDNFDYVPTNKEIGSPEYALECCFHKDERYAYQKEFRIVALNTEDNPIDDLFIPIAPDDFQVVELVDGFEFQCLIDISAEVTGRIAKVRFDCTHTLKAVIENEA